MDKTANSNTAAMKFLVKNRNEITIQSVKGTEFVNATVHQ